MASKDLVALLDLGDTLADCTPALRKLFEQMRGPNEKGEDEFLDPLPPYLEKRRKLIMSTPGFWRDLPVRPQGLVVAKVLQDIGCSLHILTKGPPEFPHVWAEKVSWCRTNLPDVAVTVTEEKMRVYGNILVDDWLPYVYSWQRQWPGGLAIVPAHPWNSRQSLGPRCLRIDGRDPVLLSKRIRDFINFNLVQPVHHPDLGDRC